MTEEGIINIINIINRALDPNINITLKFIVFIILHGKHKGDTKINT